MMNSSESSFWRRWKKLWYEMWEQNQIGAIGIRISMTHKIVSWKQRAAKRLVLAVKESITIWSKMNFTRYIRIVEMKMICSQKNMNYGQSLKQQFRTAWSKGHSIWLWCNDARCERDLFIDTTVAANNPRIARNWYGVRWTSISTPTATR